MNGTENNDRDAIHGGSVRQPEIEPWHPYWVGYPMDHDGPGKEPGPPKDWPGGSGIQEPDSEQPVVENSPVEQHKGT
jgi:hypothetical protein